MRQNRIFLLVLMVAGILATPGRGTSQGHPVPWECVCGPAQSCEVHPMIEAIVNSHGDCSCGDPSSSCDCTVHPMIGVLLDRYREHPEEFSAEDCARHPMVKAVVDAYEGCRSSAKCGCCGNPMIRAIVECWRTCRQERQGTEGPGMQETPPRDNH